MVSGDAVPARRALRWIIPAAAIALGATAWLAEHDATARRANAAAEVLATERAETKAAEARRSPDYLARTQLLATAVKVGLIARLDIERDVPRVWVTGAFLGQPRQRREQLVAAIYSQCVAVRDRCIVVVHADATGAEIGTLDSATGMVWR